jgi:hypothetical protein
MSRFCYIIAGNERLCFYRINTYTFAFAAELLVSYYTVNFGKQCIITTEPYVGTGMYLGAQLTDQNVSSPDNLTAEPFHTASLALAVPAVP